MNKWTNFWLALIVIELLVLLALGTAAGAYFFDMVEKGWFR